MSDDAGSGSKDGGADRRTSAIALAPLKPARRRQMRAGTHIAAMYACGAMLYEYGLRACDAECIAEYLARPFAQHHMDWPKIGRRVGYKAQLGALLADIITPTAKARRSAPKAPASDSEKFAIGKFATDFNLQVEDCTPLDGLLDAIWSEEYLRLVKLQRDSGSSTMPIGEVLFGYIDHKRTKFEALGRAAQWRRALFRHAEQRARWLSTGDINGAWRKAPASRGQQFLIRQICAHMGREWPVNLTRGEASDFIDAHGGSPRFFEVEP